jgi:hypothetical protein
MTAALVAKVHRLLDQRRVLLVTGQWQAVVVGDTGVYDVVAVPHGVVCTCLAGGGASPCSHALAAMVAWREAGS